MRAYIQDKDALTSITPEALSAYALTEGWRKVEPYGDYSDVYTKNGGSEIILPRTQGIGDYANVMSQLIEIFARDAEVDELSLYRDLVTADRDVVRVRADVGETGDVPVKVGVDLIGGARDMLLAAACSLGDTRPVYRSSDEEYREASRHLNRMRLGQTEEGSFVITLLTPRLDREWELANRAPIDRQITSRLANALVAMREVIEVADARDAESFSGAVEHGVNANLCNSLVKMVNPIPALDISLAWARTLPMPKTREVIRFFNNDVPVLRQAARSLREQEFLPDMHFIGVVQRLESDEVEMGGRMTLRASIRGNHQRVTADLNYSDYHRALQAHSSGLSVVAEGTLRRVGQGWNLLNPRVVDLIANDDEPEYSP